LLSFDAPLLASIDPWSVLLAVIAAVALLRMKLGMVRTLAVCATLGVVLHLGLGVIR
jgi:chromate transporter